VHQHSFNLFLLGIVTVIVGVIMGVGAYVLLTETPTGSFEKTTVVAVLAFIFGLAYLFFALSGKAARKANELLNPTQRPSSMQANQVNAKAERKTGMRIGGIILIVLAVVYGLFGLLFTTIIVVGAILANPEEGTTSGNWVAAVISFMLMVIPAITGVWIGSSMLKKASAKRNSMQNAAPAYGQNVQQTPQMTSQEAYQQASQQAAQAEQARRQAAAAEEAKRQAAAAKRATREPLLHKSAEAASSPPPRPQRAPQSVACRGCGAQQNVVSGQGAVCEYCGTAFA
jgi:uncharacterized iron-regulated membrane protein